MLLSKSLTRCVKSMLVHTGDMNSKVGILDLNKLAVLAPDNLGNLGSISAKIPKFHGRIP